MYMLHTPRHCVCRDPKQGKVRVWHLSRFESIVRQLCACCYCLAPLLSFLSAEEAARQQANPSQAKLAKAAVAAAPKPIEEVNQGNIFSVKRENDCLMVITFSIS